MTPTAPPSGHSPPLAATTLTTLSPTTLTTLSPLSPRRLRAERVAKLALGACVAVTAASLIGLLGVLLVKGIADLDVGFVTGFPSRFPERAGVYPAVLGTLWIGAVSMLFALPVGVAAAVYLNEFARDTSVTSILRASISNLAGVPSIVFGLLGLALFVRLADFGPSVAAAGLTLGILTLPIIIVASEEALKAVPRGVREAAFGLGASRWQVVRHHVLPYALPSMLTGSILALARAMGETAPLIVIGAAVFITFLPTDPLDGFTALPIQALNWAQDARPEFQELAWTAVLLLVVITFLANLAAVVLRDRLQRRIRW